MKKRQVVENEFNEMLSKYELLLKFRGDNEVTIIGAPTNNFISRIILSMVGVLLVSYCLIKGSEEDNTVLIGGALLGLILTATPFISFYSRKYFKIMFSRQTRQINIMTNFSGPYKRIDFSNIDSFGFKKIEVDDFVSPDIEIPVTYNYTLIANVQGKEVHLFSIDSKDRSVEQFTKKFSQFIHDFTKITVSVQS